MRIPSWLGSLRARLLEPVGSTVDVGAWAPLLRHSSAHDEAVAGLRDDELTARFGAIAAAAAGGDATALAEALALLRAAADRTVGLRPYDEQLLGARALLDGRVVQMATGEGKTLVAALAAALLAERGPVHVLTVNDYLARRDAEWMGPLYALLGRRAGWVVEAATAEQRRAAYAADVTYVSVNEAGFDFLRDGLCTDAADRVQGTLGAVIVDEADSILVDEARVPLVLAGSVAADEHPAQLAADLVASLRRDEHYVVGAQERVAHLTPAGAAVVEHALGGIELYDERHADLLTTVNLALHAEALLARDVDYIVRDGRVELVDEFRGRVARRRRWPDGLHAAVEAKERVVSSGGGTILGTVTVQAFIGCYRHVGGMTGTALPVGEQLREFYGLEIAVIPSHRPEIRQDLPDRVFVTRRQRDEAARAEVLRTRALGRPVLVATPSVAESERFAALLRDHGVSATVLNARNDAAEASIVAEAGGYAAVTVSTQMTGRGVDIRLGGSDRRDEERVTALGGLAVIALEHHDSRRVDDQIRGRAGRQGDPGTTIFYVSLEDDLLTAYGQQPPARSAAGPTGELGTPASRRFVAEAQRFAEVLNLEVHRSTWRYHYLLEQHRQAVEAYRTEVLTGDRAGTLLRERRPQEYHRLVTAHGDHRVADAARQIVLHHIDEAWAEYLDVTAALRESIHLRAFANLDPIDEFHRAAIPRFRRLRPRIERRAAEDFRKLNLADPDWSLAQLGLDRPSATWTYVADDTALEVNMGQFFAGVLRLTQGGWKAAKNRG